MERLGGRWSNCLSRENRPCRGGFATVRQVNKSPVVWREPRVVLGTFIPKTCSQSRRSLVLSAMSVSRSDRQSPW